MEADYASNGDLAKSKKFPLTFILSPKWGEADATISWERGRLALCATRLAGHTFVFFGDGRRKKRAGRRAPQQSAESKAHKRPNLPCAWYFALCRFTEREFSNST
ncbi:MAG: hypothetical protein DMF32_10110 [Verrucomicrobia bacterium]|nr:MAG: hypothetical protein DMF32_10110 [Verrucomicrobiota bacterium]